MPIGVGERTRTNKIPLEGKLELSPIAFFFSQPQVWFWMTIRNKINAKSLSVLPEWLVKCFPKVLEGNHNCLTI